mmetsp:Transcript_26076/g.48067  ORF Transcript_26076/g.48067 Transcript_26076/m.48067 type:complete len:94 (-) Transcript_26076:1048-1329(-)
MPVLPAAHGCRLAAMSEEKNIPTDTVQVSQEHSSKFVLGDANLHCFGFPCTECAARDWGDVHPFDALLSFDESSRDACIVSDCVSAIYSLALE